MCRKVILESREILAYSGPLSADLPLPLGEGRLRALIRPHPHSLSQRERESSSPIGRGKLIEVNHVSQHHRPTNRPTNKKRKRASNFHHLSHSQRKSGL